MQEGRVHIHVFVGSEAEVIRHYDLLHKGTGLDGKDIARPAEFLLDTSGVVRWLNLTEDIRVRTTPEDVLEAMRLLGD